MCWELFCSLACDLSWRTFHVHLKRMYILLFLDRMSCGYLLSPTGLIYHLRVLFPYWFFCLDVLSIDMSGVLKSSTIIVLLWDSPFMSVNICFIYLGFPMLGTHMLMSVISLVYSWSFYHYTMPFFVLCYRLGFKVHFVWYCYLRFLVSICTKYLFPSSHFQSVCL